MTTEYSQCAYSIIARRLALILVIKVGNRMPAVAEEMGRQLGLTVSGEETLLIALDTKYALRSRKIREIPDLLSSDTGVVIHNSQVHLVVVQLILLRVHDRRCIMHAHHRISAKLREDKRLSQLLPLIHLRSHLLCRPFQIRRAEIPAIVAVETDDIGQLSRNIRIRASGHLHRYQGDRPLLRIQFPCQIKERLEVFIRTLTG